MDGAGEMGPHTEHSTCHMKAVNPLGVVKGFRMVRPRTPLSGHRPLYRNGNWGGWGGGDHTGVGGGLPDEVEEGTHRHDHLSERGTAIGQGG
jgi:hypothetical protein